MADTPTRPYHSPLRESQAQQTRELILDALTDLLGELRSDEISMRLLAARAGVSERTVYRHFPDRSALLDGLTEHFGTATARGAPSDDEVVEAEDLARVLPGIYEAFDAARAQSRALAVLSADPRFPSADTRARTERWRAVIARSFPELDERDHLHIVAIVRNLAGVQPWLRAREEFGLTGAEAGPVMAWAVEVVLEAVRTGNVPPGVDAPDQDR